jgi:transposase-like protein
MAECGAPGASVAKVAMSHGINANVVHRWSKLAREAGAQPRSSRLSSCRCRCRRSRRRRPLSTSRSTAPRRDHDDDHLPLSAAAGQYRK